MGRLSFQYGIAAHVPGKRYTDATMAMAKCSTDDPLNAALWNFDPWTVGLRSDQQAAQDDICEMQASENPNTRFGIMAKNRVEAAAANQKLKRKAKLQAMDRHLWHPEVSSQQCKDRNSRIINAPRVRRQLNEMKQA